MKFFLALVVIASAAPVSAQEAPAATPAPQRVEEPGFGSLGSDESVLARSRASDVAGAFANEGFKLRDGYWAAALAPKQPQIIEVNLFPGNQYWFTVATSATGTQLSMEAFDESGKPVEGQTYRDDGVAALGIEPASSGRYFLRVELTEGNASPFCLLYSYK